MQLLLLVAFVICIIQTAYHLFEYFIYITYGRIPGNGTAVDLL